VFDVLKTKNSYKENDFPDRTSSKEEKGEVDVLGKGLGNLGTSKKKSTSVLKFCGGERKERTIISSLKKKRRDYSILEEKFVEKKRKAANAKKGVRLEKRREFLQGEKPKNPGEKNPGTAGEIVAHIDDKRRERRVKRSTSLSTLLGGKRPPRVRGGGITSKTGELYFAKQSAAEEGMLRNVPASLNRKKKGLPKYSGNLPMKMRKMHRNLEKEEKSAHLAGEEGNDLIPVNLIAMKGSGRSGTHQCYNPAGKRGRSFTEKKKPKKKSENTGLQMETKKVLS